MLGPPLRLNDSGLSHGLVCRQRPPRTVTRNIRARTGFRYDDGA